VIFESSDDKFPPCRWYPRGLDAGHWVVAHRQTHDGRRLVTATQLASAAGFTKVLDADLTAGRGA
jgi:hypothetical protein